MKKLSGRIGRVIGNNIFLAVSAAFFVACCIYAGFLAVGALSDRQHYEIAQLIFGLDENSFSKGWIVLIWWRLLMVCIAAVCALWSICWIISIAIEGVMAAVWALGWGCLISICGSKVVLCISFIFPFAVFVIWMVWLVCMTVKCFKCVWSVRRHTVTERLRLASRSILAMGRGFAWAIIGTVTELGVLHIAELYLESGI